MFVTDDGMRQEIRIGKCPESVIEPVQQIAVGRKNDDAAIGRVGECFPYPSAGIVDFVCYMCTKFNAGHTGWLISIKKRELTRIRIGSIMKRFPRISKGFMLPARYAEAERRLKAGVP